jgi:hypothetical protein
MYLEHADLEPFEQTLDKLYLQVFEGGIEALQKEGIISDPSTVKDITNRRGIGFRRFIRGCHYGWDLAQRRISELVIEYHNRVRELNASLKVDRKNRNREEIRKKRILLDCLESRQIVLRRLIDTILYHLINHQTWILRRVMLEYRIRDIDPPTLRKTIDVATDLNREERLNFHLVSDLTTVIHVGDLIQVRFTSKPPDWSLIELKEGRVNALLSGVIENANGELREEHIQEIRNQFGAKAVSQAQRMIRQQFRHREIERVVTTDQGIDIMHETPIKLHPEIFHVREYGEVVGGLCDKVRNSGVEVSAVDECIRLIAVTGAMYEKLGRMGIAHIFYHLQFGIVNCDLKKGETEELNKLGTIYPFFDLSRLNLYAMWPPPSFSGPCQRSLFSIYFSGAH